MNTRLINKTPFGSVALAWYAANRPVITHVLISSAGRSAKECVTELYPNARRASCAEVDQVADRIAAFLNGDDVAFSLDLLSLDRCGAFREKVLRATHAIPRGSVATYGGLAAYVGCPGGARAVGNTMATNPFPLIVPCHRVIRADLTIGSYGGGIEMKRGLLELEGAASTGAVKIPQAQAAFRN